MSKETEAKELMFAAAEGAKLTALDALDGFDDHMRLVREMLTRKDLKASEAAELAEHFGQLASLLQSAQQDMKNHVMFRALYDTIWDTDPESFNVKPDNRDVH